MKKNHEVLITHTQNFLAEKYALSDSTIEICPTKKLFEGDQTIVLFGLLKQLGLKPDVLGTELGNYLMAQETFIADFNIVKGFLNLSFTPTYFSERLRAISQIPNYGLAKQDDQPAIMVEYSSPNTNKPLHLGHIRNNVIGHALSEILQASGRKVIKTQVINDRGIHICKSMIAWQLFGQGDTPEKANQKGDHFVGAYYVRFDQEYKRQLSELLSKGLTQKEAEQQAPIMLEAQELLRKWEQKDPETIQLWETMNGWVYEGFETTYNKLGVTFDKNYYESNTYMMGKQQVKEALDQGLLYQKDDGSIWADLTDDGLDQKLLQRSDGTSVYMTQDVGMAITRFEEFDIDQLIYTVGNEQDYHFQALFAILKKMGYPWASKLYHLSYAMVILPSGKMKSREGTVVDADNLIQEMEEKAEQVALKLGKLEHYSEQEKQQFYKTIALGAIKYQILKVDPKKQILFDPLKSIDFQGNTASFIQYTYARIQSILRAYGTSEVAFVNPTEITPKEIALIKLIDQVPDTIQKSAEAHNPALIANHCYNLAHEYNSYYQETSILNPDNKDLIPYRVTLSQTTGLVIKTMLNLLGIDTPQYM